MRRSPEDLFLQIRLAGCHLAKISKCVASFAPYKILIQLKAAVLKKSWSCVIRKLISLRCWENMQHSQWAVVWDLENTIPAVYHHPHMWHGSREVSFHIVLVQLYFSSEHVTLTDFVLLWSLFLNWVLSIPCVNSGIWPLYASSLMSAYSGLTWSHYIFEIGQDILSSGCKMLWIF